MKILLDTSYFLPLVKIKVEKWDNSHLKALINQEDLTIYYSEVTILEMAAKSAKIRLATPSLTYKDTQRGIDALVYNSQISVITWHNHPDILDLAFSLREFHTDFFDCIIFATAIYKADVLGTFDDSFVKKILMNDPLCEKIRKINSNFKFWLQDLAKPKIGLNIG